MRSDWIADRLPASGRILDVGFAGERSSIVHETLARRADGVMLVGVDVNVERLRTLRLPRTIGGDGSALPFADATFTAVVAGELLEHLDSVECVLPEFSRVLRPGGRLLITTPSPYELSRWLKHWLFAADVTSHRNVRGFLGNADHEGFIEPISFCQALRRHNLDAVELTTVKFQLPLLGRVLGKPVILGGNFFPANRLGAYLCLMATKRTSP
jgi:SAM-dependent methyltransferase